MKSRFVSFVVLASLLYWATGAAHFIHELTDHALASRTVEADIRGSETSSGLSSSTSSLSNSTSGLSGSTSALSSSTWGAFDGARSAGGIHRSHVRAAAADHDDHDECPTCGTLAHMAASHGPMAGGVHVEPLLVGYVRVACDLFKFADLHWDALIRGPPSIPSHDC